MLNKIGHRRVVLIQETNSERLQNDINTEICMSSDSWKCVDVKVIHMSHVGFLATVTLELWRDL